MQNITGPRIWPVWMVGDVVDGYTGDVSDYLSVYNNVVPSTQGSGKTCLACVLNRAYDIFEANDDPTKKKYVVLMSDAVPTHCPSDGCNGTAVGYGLQICDGICDDAGNCDPSLIASQCTACTSDMRAIDSTKFSAQRLVDNFNVTIFTVGFGPVDDCAASGDLLRDIALMSNGTFQNTTNINELYDFYENISQEIIIEIKKQVVSPQGGQLPDNRLYGDSYIEIDYTPTNNPLSFGEILVTLQTPQFDDCTDNASVLSKLRVIDSRVTSYSAEHWTSLVESNGYQEFNLSTYGSDFTGLGDPYLVYVNPANLVAGNNTINIESADDAGDDVFCSENNSLIYKGMLKSTVPYSSVKEKADGCTWNVEFFDGSFTNISMPSNYTGSNTCSYTNASISYDIDDSYDNAMYELLRNLDIYEDGRVFVNLDGQDINISLIKLDDIPYMWGPVLVEVRTWQ
jgi:hypothetical protein